MLECGRRLAVIRCLTLLGILHFQGVFGGPWLQFTKPPTVTWNFWQDQSWSDSQAIASSLQLALNSFLSRTPIRRVQQQGCG